MKMKLFSTLLAATTIIAAAPMQDAKADKHWGHDDDDDHHHEWHEYDHDRGWHGHGHDVVIVNSYPHYYPGPHYYYAPDYYTPFAPAPVAVTRVVAVPPPTTVVQTTTVACPPSANRVLAGIAGGAAGGVLGHQIGHGHGRDAATIAGAVLGVIAGQSVTYGDEACSQQVLEYGNSGVPVSWQSAQVSNAAYTIQPGNPIQQDDGRYCREYQATAHIGGRTQQTYGTACRQPDGSWEILN
jgi:surface antigen